jgi:hypothetical protein
MGCSRSGKRVARRRFRGRLRTRTDGACLTSSRCPPSTPSPALLEEVRAGREALGDDLRAQGWSVAVHNDYRLNGEPHTFWLFTKDGRAVKGEGRTDADALNAIRAALASPSVPQEKVQEAQEAGLTPHAPIRCECEACGSSTVCELTDDVLGCAHCGKNLCYACRRLHSDFAPLPKEPAAGPPPAPPSKPECMQSKDEEEFWCKRDGSAHSIYCPLGPRWAAGLPPAPPVLGAAQVERCGLHGAPDVNGIYFECGCSNRTTAKEGASRPEEEAHEPGHEPIRDVGGSGERRGCGSCGSC